MKTDGWKPTCLHSSVDSLVERVISWIRRVFTAGFRIIRRVKYTEFVPPFFIRPFNRSMLKTSSIDFDSSSSFFLFFFLFARKERKIMKKLSGRKSIYLFVARSFRAIVNRGIGGKRSIGKESREQHDLRLFSERIWRIRFTRVVIDHASLVSRSATR